MRYINLIDQISEQDKERIINYISLYGVYKDDFIGLDKWLQNWSHSNQKLFKLLGNKLIHKIPLEYIKNEEAIKAELLALMAENEFKCDYHEFYWVYIRNNKDMSQNDKLFFNHLLDLDVLLTDKTIYGIKFKKEGAPKMLQLQKGMKPMRALQKVMNYFDTEWKWDWTAYDEFRIAISRVFNDKQVHGNLCFSIHPLDFITMSDNDSNWQSCMNWVEEGCYRIGTVEMMNSNNVLCCYIEQGKNTDWYFGKSKTAEDGSIDTYIWNNKKWRILAYVTKDIIMSGKSYPYKNDDYSKKVITELRDLALRNLGWTYSFGPELYLDMKYVNTEYPLIRSRQHIRHHSTTKHNILWDTNGMYNDMLNDHSRNYWCFRNKVKQNKVINVSGKCPCLCCGNEVIEYDDNEGWQYNERYKHVSNVLCCNCVEEHCCEICNIEDPTRRFHKLTFQNINGSNYYISVCDNCYCSHIMLCPGCGKPIYMKKFEYSYILNAKHINLETLTSTEEIEDKIYIIMCYDCMKNNISNFSSKSLECYNGRKEDYVFFKGDQKFLRPYVQTIDANTQIKAVERVITRLDVLSYLNKKIKNT